MFEFPRGSAPSILDIAVSLGFTTSKGEAKRLIEQGGLKLNDKAISSITATISASDLGADGTARISAGKKRHAIVKAV